jgi:hypothetical protein
MQLSADTADIVSPSRLNRYAPWIARCVHHVASSYTRCQSIDDHCESITNYGMEKRPEPRVRR